MFGINMIICKKVKCNSLRDAHHGVTIITMYSFKHFEIRLCSFVVYAISLIVCHDLYWIIFEFYALF